MLIISLSNSTFDNGEQLLTEIMTCWLAAFARILFGIRSEDDKVVELENLVEHTGRLRTIDG